MKSSSISIRLTKTTTTANPLSLRRKATASGLSPDHRNPRTAANRSNQPLRMMKMTTPTAPSAMAPARADMKAAPATPAAVAAWIGQDGTYHEFYSGAIFIGGEYFGPLQYDSGRADLRWNRNSTAYFCPNCGDIWGRLVMHEASGRPCEFEAVGVSCESHGDRWNVPGSLLMGPREALLADLPPLALRREFLLHLAHAEKELK